VLYRTEFPSLRDTETVGEATRRMLDHHVSDLPIVDASGALLGMFRLERLFAVLLPKAVTLGDGVPDLSFLADSVEQLRDRMRGIEASPVREFAVKPEHVVHPGTSPLETVLLLYRGENAIPVVDAEGGKLVGMVSARDVLATLQPSGAM
jgi:CBS domain-containing protein